MSQTDSLKFPEPPTRPAKPWGNRTGTGSNERWPGLTPESLAAYRAEVLSWEQALKAWSASCEEVAGAAARLLIAEGFPSDVSVWTERGNRGVNGRKRLRALNTVLRDFGPSCSLETPSLYAEEEWLRLAVFRDQDMKAKSDAAALRDRAIAWLLARGEVYGRDFTAETAASVALRIAGEEKISETMKRAPLSFNGQNCEGPCDGWDGESRRCQCGNRRISWEIAGTFEHPTVYGEAY